jgi:hypothetical protein
MIKKSTIVRSAGVFALAAAFTLAAGASSQVSAQRDPFKKAGWATPKKQPTGAPSTGGGAGSPINGVKPTKAGPVPVNYGPPPIEARIDYFKRMRESAAANGSPLPKVTSVLTLNEMVVSGIFKTPRGYAAMVEATPIKLSYTIYPGEKFFDGQLVAVEENRLVFRKVTKVGEGKFVASVENKPLKQYTTRAQIEGTAPAQPTEKPAETVAAVPVDPTKPQEKKADPNRFVSPLDEMNSQPAKVETGKEKTKKSDKKPVKIARNSSR